VTRCRQRLDQGAQLALACATGHRRRHERIGEVKHLARLGEIGAEVEQQMGESIPGFPDGAGQVCGRLVRGGGGWQDQLGETGAGAFRGGEGVELEAAVAGPGRPRGAFGRPGEGCPDDAGRVASHGVQRPPEPQQHRPADELGAAAAGKHQGHDAGTGDQYLSCHRHVFGGWPFRRGHGQITTVTQGLRKTNARAGWLGAGAALLLLFSGIPARAQVGLHAGVSLGATNNNLHMRGVVPIEGEDLGGASNEADALARTDVGAHYLLTGPRSTQVFDYVLSSYFYIQRGQSVSIANQLGWTALLNPSNFSQLDLALRGTQGRTSDLDLFRGHALGGSEARPTTSETFVSLLATQHLRWELSPFWELGQGLMGALYVPTGAARNSTPRTLGMEADLGLHRLWIRDQLGLLAMAGQGRSSAVAFEEVMLGQSGYPARRVDYARVGLGWGHAFSDYWSSQLEAGLLGVQVPQVRDPFLDVGASAVVTHRTDTRGTIALRAERGIVTNVYVGDVLLQNAIGLRVDYPFGHKEAWDLTGDVEYQRSRSLFVVDALDRLQVFSTSAVLGHDWGRHARLLFELNFTYQDSLAGLRNQLRTEPFTSHRTMFLVTVEMHFPAIAGGERGGGRRLGGRGGASGLDDENADNLPGSSDNPSSGAETSAASADGRGR
jgi:hypothetical protein